MEKQAALQYQLILEQQKNQALEKKIREQTTKTDGLTTELTKLLNESNSPTSTYSRRHRPSTVSCGNRCSD